MVVVVAVLARRIGELEPPGHSLKVLSNPTTAELERFTKPRGYPHVKRHSQTLTWNLSNVLGVVETTLDHYRVYPRSELMWHGLVVLEHARGEEEGKMTLYGAQFVG